MPTAKPRITITLDPHAHRVLTRLSAASDESMSEIVGGFVTMALPSLERLCLVLERARQAPDEVKQGIARAMERADRTVMPALLAAQDQGDMFLADMALYASGEVTTRQAGTDAPARPPRLGVELAAVPTPVPVTRGSGSGKTRVRGVKGGS